MSAALYDRSIWFAAIPSLVQGLHGGEQKTGALYPPASSHIFSIARKLGYNVLILFHNIPSSLPQLV